MAELTEELRRHEVDYPSLVHGPLCGEAADEIQRLRDHLSQALRQWRMYAEMEDRDLSKDTDAEAVLYRDLLAALPPRTRIPNEQ